MLCSRKVLHDLAVSVSFLSDINTFLGISYSVLGAINQYGRIYDSVVVGR